MKKILLCFITTIAAANFHAQVSLASTAGTTSGTYTTLKGAFDAINAGTHQGAITINITANTTETATAILNASGGAVNYTSVLIKPAAGVNATITSADPVATIKFNGADNVTIDGSNNGTLSRNLSINSTFVAVTGTTPVVLWVSCTATDGADNIVVKNTNFAGSSSSGTVGAIIVSGTTLGAAEINNNNFQALNNSFVRAQNGIFAVGNATNTDTGWIIKDNVIGSTVATDKMLFRGIAVQNAKNFEVSGNTITGVALPATSTGLSTGILIGAAVSNGVVYKNRISDIKQPNPAGYGAVGLYLNSSIAASNILAYNNVINDIAGMGYALAGGVADNGNGIVVGNGGGYRLYYNTVVLDTNQTNAGRPSALNIISTVTAAGAIDLRNNILVNSQTQTGDRYAIYSGAANTVFSNINYNDYFSTGTALGYLTTTRPTLADVQAGFGGNVNSVSIAPVFASATNFRLLIGSNPTLDNKGTPVTGVTVDADNNARNATTPDLGGYEFVTELLAVSEQSMAAKQTVSYYPNPVVDVLNLRSDSKIKNVEGFNLSGQKVISESINAENGTVDMRKLPSGVYFLKVNSDRGSESVKVIKK
ncbi:T9SS type A sorting domain-containing protein [Chryseobacterium caseinilyticum]|uniref:T9SS type A sorting domain-containing protein n=1 Tax=Chryseobacterium caseinilyticum TaxID=2771428 RepID=A0ABR8ZFB6_9FLAO|nr:T9SS type A sorting domain-containing protein [Chryseobacterium caseinilyticum]MBD8083986.1 T9SS type A sorting domain-containing protein [Chryseobacterium caseinilyticum]